MSIRPGFDIYFPAAEYVLALRYLSTHATAKYAELQKATKITPNSLGIKCKRMAEQGLINAMATRGMYKITPFGAKVLKAYDLYMEAMK